jgi:hypothetical protein
MARNVPEAPNLRTCTTGMGKASLIITFLVSIIPDRNPSRAKYQHWNTPGRFGPNLMKIFFYS